VYFVNQSWPILALAPSRYNIDRIELGDRRITIATSGKG
jgi:hypothetical protein